MKESELLSHIYTRSTDLRAHFPHVIVGPGDDCAVVRSPSGDQLLLKVDQLVAGRHFTPNTPLDLIARKAIARPISDIAATAGTPLAALAAATLPKDYAHSDALFDAMSRWAIHFRAPLVGGDIAIHASPDHPLTLSVSILGIPHTTRGPVLRSTAKPGDIVYVTGSLGGSFDATTGQGRHLTFEPRLTEARWLADTLGPRLHAMMDLSDGLGRDAARIADASKVSLLLDARLFPASRPDLPWQKVASDGEDHELLFTVDPAAPLPDRCPATNTPITRIGIVQPGTSCQIQTPDGRFIDARDLGWDHS